MAVDSIIDLRRLCYGLIINGAAETANDAARMNNEISADSASSCAVTFLFIRSFNEMIAKAFCWYILCA